MADGLNTTVVFPAYNLVVFWNFVQSWGLDFIWNVVACLSPGLPGALNNLPGKETTSSKELP